jgi:DNA-binding NtrC family response regulator
MLQLRVSSSAIRRFDQGLGVRGGEKVQCVAAEKQKISETFSRRSVLIVDDCADMAGCLRAGLERRGFQVTTANSGNQALEMLRKKKFGVVISDIQMPNGTGIGLLEGMRRLGDDTPIIMMTAAISFSEEQIVSIGGNGFLRKPFNINILVSMLEPHFGQWGNINI